MGSLLTNEQRKGLIYGSLISAGLAAAAASRSGGNVMDAVGAGLAGATSGYAGGLNQIVRLKHAEIENQKSEELMKAAQETRGLSRERFEFEKTKFAETEAAKAAKEGEAKAAEESSIQELMGYLETQKAKGASGFEFPLGPTEAPALPENMLEVLGLMSRAPKLPKSISEVLIKSAVPPTPEKPKQWAPTLVRMPDGSYQRIPHDKPIPMGAEPVSQIGVFPVVTGPTTELRRKTTGEKVGEIPKGISPETEYREQKAAEREAKKPPLPLKQETFYRIDPATKKMEKKSFDLRKVTIEELQAGGWKRYGELPRILKLMSEMAELKEAKEPAKEPQKKFTIIDVK